MGYIYFYVQTTKEEVERVKEVLLNEIEQLRSTPVSEKELKEIATYLKGTYHTSHETASALSLASSLDELYGLGYDRYMKYDDGIDGVTVQDVQRVAQRYLDKNKMAVVTTVPAK